LFHRSHPAPPQPRVPTRRGEPLYFTPLRPAGCWVDPEGHHRL